VWRLIAAAISISIASRLACSALVSYISSIPHSLCCPVARLLTEHHQAGKAPALLRASLGLRLSKAQPIEWEMNMGLPLSVGWMVRFLRVSSRSAVYGLRVLLLCDCKVVLIDSFSTASHRALCIKQYSIRLHFQPTRMTVRTARFVRFLAATLRSIARHERSYCRCCDDHRKRTFGSEWSREQQALRRQALSLASYEIATSEDAAIAVLRGGKWVML